MSFKIAIFTLNQWALDFEGNTQRIIDSILKAYDDGAVYRAGPELEVCGYSLEDAFFESDTIEHCWECLKRILDASKDLEIVVDVGMPVRYSCLYNCRVISYRGKVLCIRAKTSLAREGNYREFRHFQAWPSAAGVEMFRLPTCMHYDGITCVPFGANYLLELREKSSNKLGSLKIGWEICQELWDIKNVSSVLYSDFGCHLVINSSGSYWELRKLETINDMIKGISLRGGACYAYSNLVGCDGQRYIFSGRSCIYDNGKLIAITPRSSGLFEELQMITHTICPEKVDEHRAQMGIRLDMSENQHWSANGCSSKPNSIQVFIDTSRVQSQIRSHNISNHAVDVDLNPKIRFEMEIHNYVSLWLWDYLRRSQMRGFMIPLSGGLDSSTVAVLVYSMCVHLYQMRDSPTVKDYFTKCHHETSIEELSSPEKICSILLKCRYISTQYSGQETSNRAQALSKSIGANFDTVSIQNLYSKSREIIGRKPDDEVSLLDQNIQARLRMAMTYYMSEGNRIVLATGNVDEGIMGYLTKYDCSSADINPIGGLCKADLKSYLRFCCSDLFKHKEDLVVTLQEIIAAPPSAELTGSEQRDEEEIGITYDEISVLGRVRRGVYGCSGPSGIFRTAWQNRYNPPFSTHIRCLKAMSIENTQYQVATELAALVKRFYQRYIKNRHKLTVLTPALHAETYSPDDNRFDHRQFLYPPPAIQFSAIDEMVDQIKQSGDL